MALFVGGLIEALRTTIEIILNWGWIFAPFILGVLLWKTWLYYIRYNFVANIKWTMLQLTIPQEVLKSPLAMEQVFAGMHSSLYKGSWWIRYIGGRVQEWFSLEIVSYAGQVFFYIYTPTKFRKLVESNIFAQYPDAEIKEVEDYTLGIPMNVPNAEYDIVGSEFVLSKEDAYPIRVWRDFQFETKEGEADIDPLAGLMEALSTIKEGEQMWLQIGIKPVDSSWKEEGEKVVSKLIGRKAEDSKPKMEVLSTLSKEAGDFVSGAARAPFEVPTYEAKKEVKSDDGPQSLVVFLSPGEREVVEAVEKNIAKVGYETTIRAIYIAKRNVFEYQPFFSVTGAFRQFSTQNLNAIKWNGRTFTLGAHWPFKEYKARFLKKWIMFKYRYRMRPAKPFIFSIEELATIFHFPGSIVRSPVIPRIETKKSEPPPGLPVDN